MFIHSLIARQSRTREAIIQNEQGLLLNASRMLKNIDWLEESTRLTVRNPLLAFAQKGTLPEVITLLALSRIDQPSGTGSVDPKHPTGNSFAAAPENNSRTCFHPETPSVRSVCIIDDNAVDGWLVQRMIQRLAPQVKVTRFTDPQQGLAYLIQLHRMAPEQLPDILFLDLYMPQLSGWQLMEACQQLPLNGQPGGMQIYILTSSISQADKSRSQEFPQVKAYLSKPLRKDKA
jgi:CheY-like chemotaxis protein